MMITKFKLFENQNDYSGEYKDLYDLIYSNKDLIDVFAKEYNINAEKWEDYVRGELDYDIEIIKKLLPKNYRVFYDEDDDIFQISKKRNGKINYQIFQSNDEKIIDIIHKTPVYTDFKPRFKVIVGDEIIGGSTYEIDEDNMYNFDLAILDEYQGYGISKDLLNKMIDDAKTILCDGMKAHVVNNMLYQYLNKIGFETTNESGQKMAYLYF